jgi:hypothetical protein
MSPSRTAGGAATQAGTDYQNRVAAWIAVRILAEKDASPPWDLPSHVTLEFIRCETEQPVDDLLVGTSSNGHIFIQAKHALSLETSESSDLASSIDQCVRQFIAYRAMAQGKRPWERPLDGERDRLILVTGLGSSAPVRQALPTILKRLSSLAPGQVIDDAATNEQERHSLHVLRSHITRSWRSAMGTDPADDIIRELLCLIQVQTLDVDEGGSNEREAKDLLRSSVLQDPTQADSAWHVLVQACAGYATARGGADRSILQQSLFSAGIALKAPPSYRDDIERLRSLALYTAEAVSDLSKIRIGSSELKISRRSTLALHNAAEAGSLIVVGEPGAGKSGALHDLVEILHEKRDVIFFAVDRLEAISLPALRNEVGLTHNLDEILKHWPGKEPGFLIIDALDAARSEASACTFREMISMALKLQDRWKVIASIRKFDLRYSPQLHQFFPGQPPTEFFDKEFVNVRHLNVPLLSDDELEQIPLQSQALAELIQRADSPLLELLRVPFNLRLMGDLVGSGVAVESLTPIRTQIELLDRYWQERVIRSDSQADARELVLRRAAEKMVEARALHVNRADVATDPAASPALTAILSSHVLTEWQSSPETTPDRYVLTFAHHVLFDYAVARLLLRGIPENIILRLENDPELVLAIRPSLVLHFQYLWSRSHTRALFWKMVLQVMRSGSIPEVGKLIGPSVAAEQMTQLPDYESILRAMDDADPTIREAAEEALRHVVGAIVAAPPNPKRPLVGVGAGPWCELLEGMSRSTRVPIAYTVRLLLTTMCDRPDEFTPSQRDLAGRTARRLLEFAWQKQPRDGWLVIHALQAVCRTFDSDVPASANLLRRCIQPVQLTNYGYEELPWLVGEVERLIPSDARLVEDIYKTAFTYHEKRRDLETQMGSGRILSLTSNAQQDYEGARYDLAEKYPEFLRVAPGYASRALIAVLDAYVSDQHTHSGEIVEKTFDFDGKEARIRADYSAVWDDRESYRDDEPLRMLSAFDEYFRLLGKNAERTDEQRQLLDLIVTENRLAVLWRRLLACGTALPDTLGREIRFLAWALPILTSYDTTTEAGNFIKAVFSVLDPSDRARIERAILSIPESVDQRHRETGEETRDRLLGCLPSHSVVTVEAKRFLHELAAHSGTPPNERPDPIAGWTRSYGEEEYLADEGVPVKSEPNRRIQALERPLKEFTKKIANSSPTADEIESILPAIRALHSALITATADGVHSKQCDYAWDCLAEVCQLVSKVDALSCEDEVGALARAVLLEAAKHPEPVYQPEYDVQFDKHPSWGRPAARIAAAAGLTWIARHPSCVDTAVLETIQQLSSDKVPAVRFQVATRLWALYRTAPDHMWSILERFCQEEPSRGVLQGLLADPLNVLAGHHADRVVILVKTLFGRIIDGAGAKDVRCTCASIFTGLYVWQNHQECQEIVFSIADHPSEHDDEAHRIVASLRKPLMHSPVEPSDPQQDEVRLRAFALMQRILRSTITAFHMMEASRQGIQFESWTKEEQEQVRNLARLLNAIGREIYVASGASSNRRDGGDLNEAMMSVEEKQHFLREAGPIIDDLSDLSFPNLVHHLVQTLDFLAVADPESVFLRLGRIMRAGKAGGYQYDSLGADLIVRLMERYLAEHRFVLRANLECRRVLLEILDTFVQAGWPSARRLTYRMEEIFR